MSTQNVHYTREQLYDLVWSQPMLKVAKQHGISDVGMAKMCRKMNIPLPPRGYWAKLQSGQKLKRPRLPPAEPGQDYQVTMAFNPDAETDQKREQERAVERSKTIQPHLDFEKDPANKITVESTLSDPHPLVAKIAKSLAEAKPARNELLLKLPPRRLNVHVTQTTRDRALCIMDALIKGLEARGFQVYLTNDDKTVTCVKVNEEIFELSLEERVAKVEKELTPEQKEAVKKTPSLIQFYREHEIRATGQLVFKYKAPTDMAINRRWSDSEKYRLEERLNQIITYLLMDAATMKDHRQEAKRRAELLEAKRQEEQRAWQEQQRQAAELRRQAAEQQQLANEEEAQRKELFEQTSMWDQCERARAFIRTAKAQYLQHHSEIMPGSKFAQWLDWAERQADRIDPLSGQNASFWKRFEEEFPPDETALRKPETETN